MTDDEPQFTSIKERIAALKLQNGGPGGGNHAPAPSSTTPSATKWVPANSQHDDEQPAPPPIRRGSSGQGTHNNARAVPPVPRRTSVPAHHEEPAEEEEEPPTHAAPARRHPSATRLPAKAKPAPAVKPRLLAPPPEPVADDEDDEPAHDVPRRGSASHPTLTRRASAQSIGSTHSSHAEPTIPKKAPPPLPGSKRPPLPTSVFIKGGQKPVGRPKAEPEPPKTEQRFAVNGRTMPPTTPGLKPASTSEAKYHKPKAHEEEQQDEEEEEPPVTTSVAARAAAFGRKIPPVPGRPPLAARPSNRQADEEEEQTSAPPPLPAAARPPGPSAPRPPVPSTARPSVPSTARPPLPSAARPPLPAASRPVPPRPVATASPQHESEAEEEEPAPVSVSARAAALGRRLPPPAQGGKPPPLPIPTSQDNHEEDQHEHPPPIPAVRPTRTGPPPIPGNRPPPVPLASRPKTAPAQAPAVDLSPAAPFDYDNAPQGSACLLCRDFSGPDKVAAQYPLSSLPHNDTVNYLAAALCKPFTSATDKARAIFTWCHHNIAYDVDGFFGGCIPRGQTTSQQIFSGKAVCEGYANIFAEVAQAAGLECVKISGHGKGFGFDGFQRGHRLPEITGHAWNAVRIDGGEWKLIDACWGAGAVEPGRYMKRFEPLHFNASNESFGWRHYPADRRSFYRADGAVPDFEDYLVGPTEGAPVPQFYGPGYEEGFDKNSLQPEIRQVDVASYNGDYVRFLVSHVCEHYDPQINGPGPMYPFVLNIKPEGAGQSELLPLETDGFFWYLDVPASQLGNGGGEVFLSLITTINGESARGKGKDYFLKMKGRSAMSWTHVASWDLV